MVPWRRDDAGCGVTVVELIDPELAACRCLLQTGNVGIVSVDCALAEVERLRAFAQVVIELIFQDEVLLLHGMIEVLEACHLTSAPGLLDRSLETELLRSRN